VSHHLAGEEQQPQNKDNNMQTEIQLGIIPDMSNADYHAAAGISKSGLDLIAKCPAIYKARYIDGEQQEATAAMRIGAAAHMMVFQPEIYHDHYSVRPDVDGRTKEGKAIITRFVADNQGKTILTYDEHAKVLEIEAAVMDTPSAYHLVNGGVAERSYFAEHRFNSEETILRKVRPDYEANNLLIDLKTTTDASADAFSRTCWNMRYHVQAAYYLDTVEMVTGCRPDGFVFIAVEKDSGQVAVYVASKSMIEAGRAQYQHDLETYRRHPGFCRWPAHGHPVVAVKTHPRGFPGQPARLRHHP
jgi:exodeoxyribonuclease VIII